jgi:hypothetical protein
LLYCRRRVTRFGHGAPEGGSIGVLRTWTGIWCSVLDTRGTDERSCGEEIAVHGLFKRRCHLTLGLILPFVLRSDGIPHSYILKADRLIKGGVKGNILLLLRGSSTSNIRKKGVFARLEIKKRSEEGFRGLRHSFSSFPRF